MELWVGEYVPRLIAASAKHNGIDHVVNLEAVEVLAMQIFRYNTGRSLMLLKKSSNEV